MIQYIYFVKCPNCEDEHFDFFDEAKEFALGCLSKKPIITQTEVNRNDFGECTDHCDLGTIWSWEDMMTADEPAVSVFTKDDLKTLDNDPEFDDDDFFAINYEEDKVVEHINDRPAPVESTQELHGIDNAIVDCDIAKVITHSEDEKPLACKGKPVPAGMTIEQLVEEMEENEDEVECVCCQELHPKEDCQYDDKHGWICDDCKDEVVECTWCEELYDRSECRYEVDLGWLCDRCEAAIKSRGETLTFREGSYWDFLDEGVELTETSLSDIAAAANSEFGTFYDDNYFLNAAGVDDELNDIRDNGTVIPKFKAADLHDLIRKDAEKYSERGRADLYNKRYRWDIANFEDIPALDPETNELVYDKAKKTEIVDSIEAARIAAIEKSREAVKRSREKYLAKKNANKVAVEESFSSDEKIAFEYDDLDVVLYDNKMDSETGTYGDHECVVDYTYKVDKEDVIMDIWDHCLKEEDVTEVPGGLDALYEDEALWADFIAKRFDDLFEKYEEELKDKYRADAAKAFEESGYSYEDYLFDGQLDNYRESCDKPKSMLEELEDPDTYRFRLADCPECGASRSYDHETGICIGCGFNFN